MNLPTRPGLCSLVAATMAFAALLHTADAWAAPRQKKSTRKAIPYSQVLKPSLRKPFEGEWRMCIRDVKNKKVCASYFFLQQGKQVCGTWQVDAGKLRSGFLQATDTQSTYWAKRKNSRAVAAIAFACSAKQYIGGGLTPVACGDDPMNPTWERMEAGWELRTTICPKHRRAIASYVIPEYGYLSICPTRSPFERNEYYPITARKKEELLQLPWMQQCLSGQEPIHIAPSN